MTLPIEDQPATKRSLDASAWRGGADTQARKPAVNSVPHDIDGGGPPWVTTYP